MKIELAPLSMLDAGDLYHLWSDQEATQLTNWPIISTLEECAQKVARVMEHYGKEPLHFGPFVIRLHDRTFAGIIGADVRDKPLSSYEVWYFLRRDQWGKGIAGASLRELLTLMKTSGRVKQAVATAVVDNAASWRLLERHGFKRDGLITGGHRKHGLSLDLFSYCKIMD